MEQPSRLAYLFHRYAAGICTEEERAEYLQMVRREGYARDLKELIYQAELSAEVDKDLSQEDSDRILDRIFAGSETPIISLRPQRRYTPVWWAAAAVLVLLATVTWLWWLRKPEPKIVKTKPVQEQKNDVQPGGNKAVLTLADSSTIVLDDAATGKLAQQGNAKVLKTADGQLAYHSENEKPTEVLYNTLATPRGGQYQLVLPDGSKVWLNAASSIRYPTTFVGKERKVEITGEAYFEVVKNVKMPFKVKANNHMEIEVLGTHFNVNSYDDEQAIKTTLLEGRVKVTAIDSRLPVSNSRLLSPGQQAQINKANVLKIIDNVDVDEVMAWKNGLFYFNGTSIETIMNQVARWYGVTIIYEDKVTQEFVAKIPRGVPLSRLLILLEGTKEVSFVIQDKTITVKKFKN